MYDIWAFLKGQYIMSKLRKPTANAAAFEKEVRRLQRIVKIAENKGIVFLTSPIPEKPKRITSKKLDLIQSLTKSDIESKGYTFDKETGELQNYIPPNQSKRRRNRKIESIKSGSVLKFNTLKEASLRTYAEPKKKLTSDELKKIRSRVTETRREREVSDAEYKKRTDFDEYEDVHSDKYEETNQIDFVRPDRATTILHNFRAILNNAQNKNISNYLLDLMNDEMDSIGEDGLAERLANASELLIELANGASFDSTAEGVASNAYSLASLILKEVAPAIKERIEEMAYEDTLYFIRGLW